MEIIGRGDERLFFLGSNAMLFWITMSRYNFNILITAQYYDDWDDWLREILLWTIICKCKPISELLNTSDYLILLFWPIDCVSNKFEKRHSYICQFLLHAIALWCLYFTYCLSQVCSRKRRYSSSFVNWVLFANYNCIGHKLQPQTANVLNIPRTLSICGSSCVTMHATIWTEMLFIQFD